MPQVDDILDDERRLCLPKPVRLAGIFWLGFGLILTIASAVGVIFSFDKPLFPVCGLIVGVLFCLLGGLTLTGKWNDTGVVGYVSIGSGMCFTVCGFLSAALGGMTATSNDSGKASVGFGLVAVSLLGVVLSVGLIVVGYRTLGARKQYRKWKADQASTIANP